MEIQKLALFYKENRIFVALILGTNEKKRGHKNNNSYLCIKIWWFVIYKFVKNEILR